MPCGTEDTLWSTEQSAKNISLKDITANLRENITENHHRIIAVLRFSLLCKFNKIYTKGWNYENPIEEVDKPEKNQFVGKFYNSSELSEVIRLTKNTKLELPVIFGGFYGLRRSEIVGLRWSAIDFDNNVFYVNHTVMQQRQIFILILMQHQRYRRSAHYQEP